MNTLEMLAVAGPRALAALAAVALLVGFHQVVRGAVQQGELRHVAWVVHADTVWRCNALRGQSERDDCLVEGRQVAVALIAVRHALKGTP
jgi:hypothetical protein